MTIDEALSISYKFDGNVAIVTPIEDYEWIFEHPEIKKLQLKEHASTYALNRADRGDLFYLYITENSAGLCIYGSRLRNYPKESIATQYLEVERDDLMVQYLKAL